MDPTWYINKEFCICISAFTLTFLHWQKRPQRATRSPGEIINYTFLHLWHSFGRHLGFEIFFFQDVDGRGLGSNHWDVPIDAKTCSYSFYIWDLCTKADVFSCVCVCVWHAQLCLEKDAHCGCCNWSTCWRQSSARSLVRLLILNSVFLSQQAGIELMAALTLKLSFSDRREDWKMD